MGDDGHEADRVQDDNEAHVVLRPTCMGCDARLEGRQHGPHVWRVASLGIPSTLGEARVGRLTPHSWLAEGKLPVAAPNARLARASARLTSKRTHRPRRGLQVQLHPTSVVLTPLCVDGEMWDVNNRCHLSATTALSGLIRQHSSCLDRLESSRRISRTPGEIRAGGESVSHEGTARLQMSD